MYFPDLSPYSYSLGNRILPKVECVGWLDKEHPFPQKGLPQLFFTKLLELLRSEQVRVMRGLHHCPFCDEESVWLEGREVLLGHAEIWIPSQTRDVVFAAPTLIYHYCEKHTYSPPDEFIDAVLAFDLESGWSGPTEAKKRIDALYAKIDEDQS
jgi:hypothetical protein